VTRFLAQQEVKGLPKKGAAVMDAEKAGPIERIVTDVTFRLTTVGLFLSK
jgi:hypothetical protein